MRADLTRVAAAIVKLGIRVPRTARTAETLGTEREGTGIVINESGLILTIGYLLLEAESIIVVTHDGKVLPATVAGFDHATGFGLVRTSQPVACAPIAFSNRAEATALSPAWVAAYEGAGGISCVSIVARRAFTGWWEYALADALFTAPGRDHHSGAALLDEDGHLLGVGSLFVGDTLDSGAAFPGNMFVPASLLPAILDDLVAFGRRRGPARPWLGVYTEDLHGHVIVTNTLKGAPAAASGVKRGDVVLAVDDEAVGSQAEFYRLLWTHRAAGDAITLKIWRDNAVREFVVRSIDRMDYLRPWPAGPS